MLDLADRLDVGELMARWAHAIDKRDWDSFGSIFTEDVCWDASALGRQPWNGLAELISSFKATAEKTGHPIGHYFANTMLDELPDGNVRAQSKVLLLQTSGAIVPVYCDDICVRTPAGWRIQHRISTPASAAKANSPDA